MTPLKFFCTILIVGTAVMFLFALPDQKQTQPASIWLSAAAQPAVHPKANLSPRDQYIDLMLEFQYRFEDAFHAGLCGLRSEGYFVAFRVAQSKLSFQLAQQLGLSQNEVGTVDAEVNRRFAKIHERVPEFNITEGCAYLRTSSRMVELDDIYWKIRGNYQ